MFAVNNRQCLFRSLRDCSILKELSSATFYLNAELKIRAVIFTSEYSLASMVMGHKASEMHTDTNIIFMVKKSLKL